MKKNEEFLILVVDDDEDVRCIVVDELQFENYKILQASDGIEALEIIKNNHIDLMISDIRMPGMDGVELLLKAREQDPDVPIIILMSGYAKYTREEILEKGAAEFINKPIDYDLLMKLVHAKQKELVAA